jgi:hypothetical protein
VICAWILVRPNEPMVTRTFEVYGTGHTIASAGALKHVGTVLVDQFVWHVFERAKP